MNESSALTPLELTPVLVFQNETYQLILNNGLWHLYGGPRTANNFGHFLILKADARQPSSGPEGPPIIEVLEEARNLCKFFCNVWVARDKYMKLVSGASSSMTYQPYRQRRAAERQAPLDLSTLRRLSLDDVFNVLAGH